MRSISSPTIVRQNGGTHPILWKWQRSHDGQLKKMPGKTINCWNTRVAVSVPHDQMASASGLSFQGNNLASWSPSEKSAHSLVPDSDCTHSTFPPFGLWVDTGGRSLCILPRLVSGGLRRVYFSIARDNICHRWPRVRSKSWHVAVLQVEVWSVLLGRFRIMLPPCTEFPPF